MDPRDYTTWTHFADHPVIRDRDRPAAEWSSNPAMYDGNRCKDFMPELYVHVDPPLPTEVQAAIAERDIKNFAAVCHAIHQAFGPVDHELFLLDDLTACVSLRCEKFHVEFYGHDFGDDKRIVSAFVLEPTDCEFTVDSISEFVPTLLAILS